MTRLKFKYAAFVIVLLSAVGFAQTQLGFTTYTTTWANNTRTYGVFIPQKGMPANPPMLFYLHGTFAGSATPWNDVTQWIAMANEYKFIAVWPLSTCATPERKLLGGKRCCVHVSLKSR